MTFQIRYKDSNLFIFACIFKMTKMVIEKGVHADIDELARLYDDLNDFLDSDINHPGWIKGVYPVRQIAETGINEQNLYVVRLEGRII